MYLSGQMDAGRLRRVPPVVALQSLIGGIMFHLLSEALLGALMDIDGEQAVMQMAETWLRGMRSDE